MPICLGVFRKTKKGVIIAGNGHVRKDYGMPWYLRRLNPEAKIATVGLFSQKTLKANPEVFSQYDFIVALKDIENEEDPCNSIP